MQKIMNAGSWLFVCFLLLVLSACAKPESEITKTYDIGQESYEGHNILVLVLDADVESKSTIRQDAKTDARTKLDAALAQNGSTQQNARQSAGAAMDAIKSLLDATREENQTNSNNDQSTNNPPAVTPSKQDTPDNPSAYKNTEVVPLDPLDGNSNKMYGWTKQTGAVYGKNLKIIFDGCNKEWIVEDPSKPNAADGNLDNHNQMYWFAGTPPQKDRTGGNRASVFSPISCGGRTATLYYNKI